MAKKTKLKLKLNASFFLGLVTGAGIVLITIILYLNSTLFQKSLPENSVPGDVDSYLTCRSKCISTSNKCEEKCQDDACRAECINTGRRCIYACHKK